MRIPSLSPKNRRFKANMIKRFSDIHVFIMQTERYNLKINILAFCCLCLVEDLQEITTSAT